MRFFDKEVVEEQGLAYSWFEIRIPFTFCGILFFLILDRLF